MGGSGPALIPETLSRVRGEALAKTISEGRVQTQMPAFSQTLSNEEIAALSGYINSPLGFSSNLDRSRTSPQASHWRETTRRLLSQSSDPIP